MRLVTYVIFNFKKPDASKGYTIDKPTFLEYIESDRFKKKLADKKILGSNTHDVRDLYKQKLLSKSSIGNMEDMVLRDVPSNIVTDLRIGSELDPDDVVADILILDTPGGRGDLIQMLLGVGSKLEISVSIAASQDHFKKKYKIIDFLGIDFTYDPAFETSLLKVKTL